MSVNGAFLRDENFVPIQWNGLSATKTITYAALTTGAVGTTTLFTITGVCSVRVFAVCSDDLTGSGTLEVGIVGSTPTIIAQTAATAIDNGEIWNDNGPSKIEVLGSNQFILSNNNIIQTIASDTVTGGTLTYYCLWFPISADGNVTVA